MRFQWMTRFSGARVLSSEIACESKQDWANELLEDLLQQLHVMLAIRVSGKQL
jgi:hypothetical protein